MQSGIYSPLYVFEARGHYVHTRTVRSKLVEDVGCRQERRDIIEESNLSFSGDPFFSVKKYSRERHMLSIRIKLL